MVAVSISMQGIDLTEGLNYGVRMTIFGIVIITISGISAASGIGVLMSTLGYSVGINLGLSLRGINTTLLSVLGAILTITGIISLVSGLIALVYKLIVDSVSRGARAASNTQSQSRSS
ncbi:MAG: hypothetical protein J07HQW2_01816 [Haloquadratum walsbyi J07HQW2]|jgi:hypothetical protein|uniref:Uncharacterized protein n=2 Tax=Haloquadratum walsbyi TaxID=293091 RepID=U1PSM9_9EURY|nr:MAG: hypothetical protein J07HQW2_01816 [Haloquadratum walsbyi J07HQW2]